MCDGGSGRISAGGHYIMIKIPLPADFGYLYLDFHRDNLGGVFRKVGWKVSGGVTIYKKRLRDIRRANRRKKLEQ